MSALGSTVTLDLPFDGAVEAVTAALAAEGFGVISRIDLDKAFAEKLGRDFHRYTILGACNPGLAHKAVTARPEVGLLLPCNVTIEDTPGGRVVRIIDAASMMSIGDLGRTPEIVELGADASARLGRVALALRGGAKG
ncbi:DUF302 domain-containing protein [Amaricoccus solimangrovi]|uniref:DUF302 domain-containing protein n=1 Tax=Amaricoccus solimangrovi TaxID=2589815 RepID=A0A501X033_9RHOB|nr:DUF302 domain-containing protein [Amaricoccus solimangrovi]TPE51886.1 DUF302 domain-containing protein [Amaricoccus solimangrovi]